MTEEHNPPQVKRTEALAAFEAAVESIGGDTDYLIDALTEKFQSLRSVSAESSLLDHERRFLIETGVLTEPELDRIASAVAEGLMQHIEVHSWLFWLLDTLSYSETASQLEITPAELRRMVGRNEVLSSTVAGRLRFPRWQFATGPEGRLLPGLSELVPEMPSLGILSWSAFMHSPAEELSGHGPRTPIQWLREGGDIEPVLELLTDGWMG